MNNLILFFNAFLSYLLLFVLIVVLVIIAIVCGVKLRQSKKGKASAAEIAEGESQKDKIEA